MIFDCVCKYFRITISNGLPSSSLHSQSPSPLREKTRSTHDAKEIEKDLQKESQERR